MKRSARFLLIESSGQTVIKIMLDGKTTLHLTSQEQDGFNLKPMHVSITLAENFKITERVHENNEACWLVDYNISRINLSTTIFSKLLFKTTFDTIGGEQKYGCFIFT